jgi:hypothetical protein
LPGRVVERQVALAVGPHVPAEDRAVEIAWTGADLDSA